MEMEMQRLNPGMMARYEIEDHRPNHINAVQFGMGEAMLGAVDRLIDDYNAASPENERVGLCAFQAGEAGFAERLARQEGLYTLLIRGYVNEEALRREQVVQCVLRAVDPEKEPEVLAALAADSEIAFALVDDTPEAVALATRFIALRRAAGLPELTVFHLGVAMEEWAIDAAEGDVFAPRGATPSTSNADLTESDGHADRRDALQGVLGRALARPYDGFAHGEPNGKTGENMTALPRRGAVAAPAPETSHTIKETDAETASPRCAAFPMLADSLAFRAEPDEAARQCAEMNYLDDMLHIAEPYARLTAWAPKGFGEKFPLERAPGVRLTDLFGMIPATLLKAQLFDAGLFLMAAPGWLNGCDTLSDCMRDERLRKFVGEGFTEELMPALSEEDREIVVRCVIECFERYENPLNRNRILRAAGHLIGRFMRGAHLSMRALAEENFEPPRRLAFALAATVMLYAGARPNPETGLYEVARGKQTEAIHDDPAILARFATLSHDMDPESLAYAALADRELWDGADLREIDGLTERVALDIAAMQRNPGWLPEGSER